MLTAPIRVSDPAPQNTVSTPVARSSLGFAALLNQEKDKSEPVKKDPKQKQMLSVPVEVAQQQLLLDTRSLKLRTQSEAGLHADQKQAPTTPEQVDSDQDKAAQLHKGALAFAVNFEKQASGTIPPSHGMPLHSAVATAENAPGATKDTNAPTAVTSADNKKHNEQQTGDQDRENSQQQQGQTPTAASATAASQPAAHTPAAPVTAHAPAPVAAVHSAARLAHAEAVAASAPVQDPQDVPVIKARSIDLQVSNGSDREVTVRVAQRAGDVEVTVRTPDADMAQSLRQHLPELSRTLAAAGARGEMWEPETAQSSKFDSNADSEHAGGNAQAQQQMTDQGGASNREGQQRKAWLEQLYGKASQ